MLILSLVCNAYKQIICQLSIIRYALIMNTKDDILLLKFAKCLDIECLEYHICNLLQIRTFGQDRNIYIYIYTNTMK
jgi:hypothetical protein